MKLLHIQKACPVCDEENHLKSYKIKPVIKTILNRYVGGITEDYKLKNGSNWKINMRC